MLQAPKHAKKKFTSAADRLFIGVMPTGFSYADKQRERHGDYMSIARLPFSTLELEWSPGPHPAELRKLVEQHAAGIVKRRGQEYQVSTSGQTVTLGYGKRDHATRKKTGKQLDAEIADILAGPTVGPGAFKPGQRVRCSYRGAHVGKVLSLDDPRAWANTLAFPQDKPNRLAVKEHLLRHPTVGVQSIPVLYKFGVQWDSRDALSPA
jgi:hypothetical protein